MLIPGGFLFVVSPVNHVRVVPRVIRPSKPAPASCPSHPPFFQLADPHPLTVHVMIFVSALETPVEVGSFNVRIEKVGAGQTMTILFDWSIMKRIKIQSLFNSVDGQAFPEEPSLIVRAHVEWHPLQDIDIYP
ncbi:hypothetical protein FRB91_001247 [Serendipita sp. 411]|nr:hypothetical protein FRB91_001247 [Serendipita sp. 411]